ncbi:MAG: hypothetical protein IPJ33_14730 [Gammaproteobacteria bacterium]|nr:hypothetical protein [Gammaproteobacteria bacterium]
MSETQPPLTEDRLNEIIDQYSQPDLRVSLAFSDGGTDPLWPRFHRSVLNQMDGGRATTSRYAIWANTVRDNIIEGMRVIDAGDVKAGRQHLVRAANSLSAFTDVQAFFDPFELGKRN